jgi:hexulose-6-phosphate isomerase
VYDTNFYAGGLPMSATFSAKPNRRQFIRTAAVTAAALAGTAPAIVPGGPGGEPEAGAAPRGEWKSQKLPIFLSVKMGMVGITGSLVERFEALKTIGYDGVELNSPGGVNKSEALAASKQVGLPIHGVVDSIHWNIRLSDPDPEVRQRGLDGLIRAIKDTHYVGGTAVLLVPGAVRDPANENQQQVWDRSIEQIRKAIPLAAKTGVHILIENVWNGFCYTHDGPANQSADQLAAYLDAINSPWVGSYFDIGNHQKYGKPAQWIRTLGKRIVKLDVKDWGKSTDWADIGHGDIDWPDVREALKEIGYAGWATAEVGGGDYNRLKLIHEQMVKVFDL